jgi:integrase
MARQAASDARRLLLGGRDPLVERRAAKAEAASLVTFDEMTERHLARRSAGWRNAKHAAQWQATLSRYASPVIGGMNVRDIAAAHIEEVLRPIWIAKHETASRVRQRIEAVLDAAAALGLTAPNTANPARLKGNLDHLLPPFRKAVKHHAALPVDALPAVMTALGGQRGMAALAVRYLVLTAARAGEVVGAAWSEIDERTGVWTVPADRTKRRREHRVPLSPQALAVLAEAKAVLRRGDRLVFRGGKAGRPLSLTSLMKALRIASGDGSTVHGLRSVFADWAAERAHEPREIVEQALAHTVGSEVERAYRRGDVLERRRELMKRWADFACTAPARSRGGRTRR